MAVDFGRTAGDYGRYRPGFPDALFERLAAMEDRLAVPHRVFALVCTAPSEVM